ncbi:hypothetical protein HYR69_03510 [Candidatus Sumerlaeota bacterium]|nr:hypothetical protein [Candidatus Sumerlaeota bacterium]
MQIPLIIFALQCGRFSAARNVWRWIPIAMMVVDPAFTFYKEYVDFTYKGTGRIDLALAAAFEGLDKRAKPGDLTLAPPMIGDLLPAFSRTNTYVGHSFQTDDFYRKAKEVDAFITSMPDSERLEFLRRIGARFVLVPPMSDALHAAFKLPGWNRIYAKSGYEIYTNAD